VSLNQCGACRASFGSMEMFEAHQHWDRTGEWKLTCVIPPGLVQDRHGTWQTPEGLAGNRARAARLAQHQWHGRRARSDVTVTGDLL
jgi:hypothetical protein